MQYSTAPRAIPFAERNPSAERLVTHVLATNSLSCVARNDLQCAIVWLAQSRHVVFCCLAQTRCGVVGGLLAECRSRALAGARSARGHWRGRVHACGAAELSPRRQGAADSGGAALPRLARHTRRSAVDWP